MHVVPALINNQARVRIKMISNKKLGTDFEHEMVDFLAKNGYWVHFLSPASNGSQPFDLIFVKDGLAMVADCKTCANRYFSIKRLEDNQIMAFEKWLRCGNISPVIFVKHNGKVYTVSYEDLKTAKKVDLYAL